MSLCPYLAPFLRYSEILVKIRQFTHLYLALMGLRRDFWRKSLGYMALFAGSCV